MISMTEQQFEALLRDSIQMYGHTYVPEPPEDMEEHVFSKRYERKMKRLVRSLSWRSCIPAYSPRLLFSRRGLALQFTIMILLSVAPLSAAGDGLHLPGLNIHDNQQFSMIRGEKGPDDPATFEQYYQVTWIPEGFERTYRPLVIYNTGALDYVYSHGETNIYFSQWTKNSLTMLLDTEEELYDKIEIQGHKGFIHEYDIFCNILIEYNGYLLKIMSVNPNPENEYIGSDVLIKMIESVEEVSWETMIAV